MDFQHLPFVFNVINTKLKKNHQIAKCPILLLQLIILLN